MGLKVANKQFNVPAKFNDSGDSYETDEQNLSAPSRMV